MQTKQTQACKHAHKNLQAKQKKSGHKHTCCTYVQANEYVRFNSVSESITQRLERAKLACDSAMYIKEVVLKTKKHTIVPGAPFFKVAIVEQTP